MTDDKKDMGQAGACCSNNGKCGRCGACKFVAGVLIGLLIAGTGLGVFLAGRCGGHSCCMMSHHMMCPMPGQAEQPSK